MDLLAKDPFTRCATKRRASVITFFYIIGIICFLLAWGDKIDRMPVWLIASGVWIIAANTYGI